MDTTNELLLDSVQFLKKQNIEDVHFQSPLNPAIFLYFGDASLAYHKELKSDLLDVWGSYAGKNLFYKVEIAERDYRLFPIDENGSGNQNLDEDEVLAQVQGMLETSSTFGDKSKIAIYCLLDTQAVQSKEEFEACYALIDTIKSEYFTQLDTLTMLILILHESLGSKNMATDLRISLHDLYKKVPENEHSYDSVFIYSNRLKEGYKDIDPQKAEYKEFNLFSNLVLLANTDTPLTKEIRRSLYDKTKAAITAAYGDVQKPLHDIALITYQELLARVREKIVDEPISSKSMQEALNISESGDFPIAAKTLESLRTNLPDDDFVYGLPGDIDINMSFTEANSRSYKGLSAFVEKNYTDRLAELLENLRVEEELETQLSSYFSAPMLSQGISINILNDIFENIQSMRVIKGTNISVKQYIESEKWEAVLNVLKDKAQKTVEKSVEKSQKTMSAFQTVYSSINSERFTSAEQSINNTKSKYKNIVLNFINSGEKLDTFYKQVFQSGNSDDNIFQILEKYARECFESTDLYKKSYIQELRQRIGQSENNQSIQRIIDNELTTKNSENQIGLHSDLGFPEHILEIYFLNTISSDGQDLITYISQKNLPNGTLRKYFPITREDKIESIWFYKCEEQNLLV